MMRVTHTGPPVVTSISGPRASSTPIAESLSTRPYQALRGVP